MLSLFSGLVIVIIGIYFSGIRSSKSDIKVKGITLVAPPKPFDENPMMPLIDVHANWVCLVPYAYSPKNKPEVRYGSNQWQWWGERPEGIIESIMLAKKAGLKILLKPQVYIHGGWVGSMQFETEEDWLIWENSFENYIISFADIAAKYDVEMLCIATEYDLAAHFRPAFFIQLIEKIRKIYDGKLTYSANWDNISKISFWQHLDYIGVSAYFPLLEDVIPAFDKLCVSWQTHINILESVHRLHNKPILFTEFGYLSVDGAAGKTWELEKNIQSLQINEEAQAIAFEALFSSFWEKPWWAGGFIWKWFPNGEGHEGYPEKDYTPQNKKAESVIQSWYSK